MSIAVVNGRELEMKYYEAQPVITLSEVDMIHEKNGSARRNFNYHSERFIEGIDYYTMPVSEFRVKYNPNFTGKRGNPNIQVVLLTESGYLLLAKTFNDDLAWDIQRALVNNYFKHKTKGPDIFEYLREMLNVVETQSHLIASQQGQIQAIENKMAMLDERIQDTKQLSEPVEKDYYTPTYVARQLNLFTITNGNPHTGLVNQMAYQAGIPSNLKTNYEDMDIRIQETMIDTVNEVRVFTIQYTKEGIRKITQWFNENKDCAYFETHRLKNSKYGKAGELKNRGFRVGRTKYYIA